MSDVCVWCGMYGCQYLLWFVGMVLYGYGMVMVWYGYGIGFPSHDTQSLHVLKNSHGELA